MPAVAQVSFRVGPQIGLNISTAHFDESANSSLSYKAGIEAGLLGSLQYKHFAFRPAVLFSQKGYKIEITTVASGNVPVSYGTSNVRLNYLTVPFNFAYSAREDGQGFQAFAGPYMGFLLGGHFHSTYQFGSSPSVGEYDGKVIAGDDTPATATGNEYYSKRLDTGLQGGIGYCYHGILLQASYSLGLRDLSATIPVVPNASRAGIPYYNRVFQVSIGYWLGVL